MLALARDRAAHLGIDPVADELGEIVDFPVVDHLVDLIPRESQHLAQRIERANAAQPDLEEERQREDRCSVLAAAVARHARDEGARAVNPVKRVHGLDLRAQCSPVVTPGANRRASGVAVARSYCAERGSCALAWRRSSSRITLPIALSGSCGTMVTCRGTL